MSDDLVAWLRAQLDEDEGLARMAFAEHNAAIAEWNEIWSGTVEIGPDEDHVCCNDSGVSRHIVNWDPARVLAEVDAKRRILALHAPVIDGTQSSWTWFAGSESASLAIVKLLARPYAGREGYREEWRP